MMMNNEVFFLQTGAIFGSFQIILCQFGAMLAVFQPFLKTFDNFQLFTIQRVVLQPKLAKKKTSRMCK